MHLNELNRTYKEQTFILNYIIWYLMNSIRSDFINSLIYSSSSDPVNATKEQMYKVNRKQFSSWISYRIITTRFQY